MLVCEVQGFILSEKGDKEPGDQTRAGFGFSSIDITLFSEAEDLFHHLSHKTHSLHYPQHPNTVSDKPKILIPIPTSSPPSETLTCCFLLRHWETNWQRMVTALAELCHKQAVVDQLHDMCEAEMWGGAKGAPYLVGETFLEEMCPGSGELAA